MSKIVYVSYPGADDVDVPASADRALDLRETIEGQGHELVTTSETGEALVAELADAEVLITTPFWPVYLDEARLKRAGLPVRSIASRVPVSSAGTVKLSPTGAGPAAVAITVNVRWPW